MAPYEIYYNIIFAFFMVRNVLLKNVSPLS